MASVRVEEQQHIAVNVGDCEIFCLLWSGRNKSVAIYEIIEVDTGQVWEQCACMGLWYMREDLILQELDFPANTDYTVTKGSVGQLFILDDSKTVRFDVRIRGT